MDIVTLMKKQRDCIADAPPPCTAACPLGIDIREFIRKIRTGLYSAAYKVFNRFAVLPGVVCHICDAPCQDACVRREIDDSISLRELELFCWQQVHDKPPESYYLPAKKNRILVVGGSLAGIACAVKLAQRGYSVQLVEKSKRLGGRLWDLNDDVLPKGVLQEDLIRLSKLKYLTLTFNTQVKELNSEGYDAVLVATGTNNENFGAKGTEQGQFLNKGIFFAQRHNSGQEFLQSIYQGSMISYQIEEYMKIGKVITQEERKSSFIFRPVVTNIVPIKKINMHEPQKWTSDEAKFEAERCLLCQCSNCSDLCVMMKYYHKSFQKFMVETNDTINSILTSGKPALYSIMSCTQCGSCRLTCPVNIDIKSICLESRRVLHKRGSLPDAHYQYWLNDMLNANSEEARLFIPSGAQLQEKNVYFPGCQMGASKPEYVFESYKWLVSTFPNDVALMLYCCGAPAYWSGNEKMHNEVVDMIRKKWMEWGKPNFILSCPSCAEIFSVHIPEIRTVSLWELMANHIQISHPLKGTVSVFDPCSSKEDSQTRKNIRRLVEKAGYSIVELETRKDESRCCGQGGLIYSTNPELFNKICESNKALSDLEFITYCTNCKDIFNAKNKASRHILDILFEQDFERQNEVPDLTERRHNRRAVKRKLMKEMLDMDYKDEIKDYQQMKLIMTPEIKSKMNLQLIIEDDVKQVIAYAESTGNRLYCKETDQYTAHLPLGSVTFWVQYRPTQDGFSLSNVYFHRLSIVEE